MAETVPTKRPVKMYAIQRKSDGKWSRGGCGPSWGAFPKTWGNGPFKNHLLMFQVSDWTLNVTRVKEYEAKFGVPRVGTYYTYPFPDEFIGHKLLSQYRFPYFDCEVVEFDPNTLGIINRFPAEEWVWDNCFKPNYEKSRYIEQIREYCKEYDKDF